MKSKNLKNKEIKIPVINNEGVLEGEEKIAIPALSEGVSSSLLATAVRVYLSNQRRSMAKTKTRAEVEGSKCKIWKQKGTGRARHGDRQAPIFVGGGVPHGPRANQNYNLKLNKKMIKKVILTILLDKISQKKLFLLKKTDFKKTKEAYLFFEKITGNLKIKGKVAFLLNGKEAVRRCVNNLDKVQTLSSQSLNPFFLLKNNYIFLSQLGLKGIESYFEAGWENADKS